MELILFFTALIALLFASGTDLKTREVPDWLNYGLLFAALGIRFLFSYSAKDYSIFLEGVFGFAVLFAFACFLFYTGQWGGGDSKLLMALGAIFGLEYSANMFMITFFISFTIIFVLNLIGSWAGKRFKKNQLKSFNIAVTIISLVSLIVAATMIDFRSDLVVFLFYLIALGGVYGILWSFYLAVIKWKKFSRCFTKLMNKRSFINTRRAILVLCLILLGASYVFDTVLLGSFVTIFAIITMYLWIAVKAIELSCMEKDVLVTKLTEGDWIVKDVIVDNKRICGPSDLGITKEQIKKLNLFYKNGKVRKVRIKEGIPFVPSFLFAFIATYYLADITTSLIR